MHPDEPSRTYYERDDVMRRSLEHAATGVQRHAIRKSFLEVLLEEALVRAWELQAPGGTATPRVQLQVPGWDPQPGATDLLLSLPGDRHATAVAEIKVLDVDQTLWDLLKVTCLVDGSSRYARAYLVVATTPKRWRDAEVAALYAPPNVESPDGVRDWTTADLVSRWKSSWAYLLEGGRARPRDVPGEVRITFLGAYLVPTFPEYELRAIAVEPLDGLRRLGFGDDGWPLRAPRRADGLGLRDLLDAHLAADQYRDAHPDLRSYHETRATALAQAFGIRIDDPPHDDAEFAQLLAQTLDEMRRVGSPFDHYLEAPEPIAALYRRHGAQLADAADSLRDALADLAVDLVAALWRIDRDAAVSTAELTVHGFDPASPEPDPIDYW